MKTVKQCESMIKAKEGVIAELWNFYLDDKITANTCAREIQILQYEIRIIKWFID